MFAFCMILRPPSVFVNWGRPGAWSHYGVCAWKTWNIRMARRVGTSDYANSHSQRLWKCPLPSQGQLP